MSTFIDDPVMPPRKFLTRSFGGAMTAHLAGPCTLWPNYYSFDGTISFAGASTVDPITGVLTYGGTQTVSAEFGDCGYGGPGSEPCNGLDNACFSQAPQTPTTQGYIADTCWTGGATDVLSSQDSESNAIIRLLNSVTWSGWNVAGAGGCDPQDCCAAAWEQRLGGFEFYYQEAKWKLDCSGLVPGTVYCIKIKIFRKTYIGGTFALYQTQTVTATVDSFGNIEFTGTTPNAVGYTTYANYY
jgi:hypothetical protein